MKYALPRPPRRDRLGRHREPASDGAEQPIDGRPFLRAAREVHAAQQDLLVESGRGEDVGDEPVEQIAQRRHLLREREDPGPAADVAILIEPREDALVQPEHERIEFRGEGLRRLAARGLLVRERDTPDLRAAVLLEVVEVLGEAGDQIALGHHHVDRELDLQLLVQLVEPSARRRDVAPRGRRAPAPSDPAR